MKIKVFQYGSYPRNNQIVSHSIEVEQVDNDIYVYTVEKDKNDNSNDIVGIVLKIGDYFFEVDQCLRKTFELPQSRELAQRLISDYPGFVKERIEKNQHVSLMDIQVFKMLGIDTSPLFAHRKKGEDDRLASKEKRQKELEEKKQQEIVDENNRLLTLKQQYLDGQYISGEDFVDICRKDNFAIHPRTVGTFYNSVINLNKTPLMVYGKQRGKPKLDGCCLAIRKYNEFLQNMQNENYYIDTMPAGDGNDDYYNVIYDRDPGDYPDAQEIGNFVTTASDVQKYGSPDAAAANYMKQYYPK